MEKSYTLISGNKLHDSNHSKVQMMLANNIYVCSSDNHISDIHTYGVWRAIDR